MDFNIFDYIRKHIGEIDSCSVIYKKDGEEHTFEVKKQGETTFDVSNMTAEQIAEEMVGRLESAHGVNREKLLSQTREDMYAIPRDIIIYVLASHKPRFTPDIITATVNRDRCTYYNAIKVVNNMLSDDNAFFYPYRPMLSDLMALFGKK